MDSKAADCLKRVQEACRITQKAPSHNNEEAITEFSYYGYLHSLGLEIPIKRAINIHLIRIDYTCRDYKRPPLKGYVIRIQSVTSTAQDYPLS